MTHKNCKNYMSNNTDKFIIRYMILTQMQLSQRCTYKSTDAHQIPQR